MKEEKYILNLIKKNLKNKEQINSGYGEVLYSVFKQSFNFSYADKEWINKDKLFIDNEVLTKVFFDTFKLECQTYYNLPLTVAIGTSLGAKKINKFILNENKKAKLLNYDNYFICDYDKLSSGDFLSGIYYAKEKLLDNLIVIAIKNNTEKTFNLINIYEECGFEVNEIKVCKSKLIIDALKTAKKSKKASLLIVNNNNEERELDNAEEIDLLAEIKSRTNIVYKKWLLEYDKEINDRHDNILEIINYLKDRDLNIDLENIQFNLEPSYESTLIASSEKIFKILQNKSKYVVNVEIKDSRVAALISMGLSIAGLKPSTTIKDFTCVKDIISLANCNKLPINFIIENNCEEIYINDLNVYIPADMHEVIGSWSSILKANTTSLIVLSNKETTLIKNTNLKYVKYGAYMIKKETDSLAGIIVASGDDLKLALGVAGLLEKEEIMFRVVTLPCPNLLLKQVKYKKELMSRKVKIFVLDKNLNVINNKFASDDNCIISSDLGLDKVKEKIKEELNI